MSLSQHFEIEVEGFVWKQFIDPLQNYLILEVRNADLHQVSFHVIQLETGNLIHSIFPKEETWWIGIQEVINGKIIAHAYESEQSPIHKGVTIYDSKSATVLWENQEVYFYQKEENIIWVSTSEQEFLQLEISDGKVLKTQKEIPFIITSSEELVELPLNYSEENTHFKTIFDFLKQLQGVEAVKTIEYWESLNRIVISYYICDEKEKLENYLLVLSIDGEILFQDCLDVELSGIGMDTFYVYQEKLFFIQEKRKLISINL